MKSIEAYFLGILTVVFIWLVFWLTATLNTDVGDFYRETVGYQICTTSPTS